VSGITGLGAGTIFQPIHANLSITYIHTQVYNYACACIAMSAKLIIIRPDYLGSELRGEEEAATTK